MRKLIMIVSATAGFLLGSWSGRGPYEALRRQVDSVLGSVREEGGTAPNARSQDPPEAGTTRARLDAPADPPMSTRDPWPSHVAV